MIRPPELLQQAELLKSSVLNEKGEIDSEIRSELQHLLESILLFDVDYAVSRQIEQTLWNFCFKNCIDSYQNKLRRRKTETDVANLQLFLDSCIGYFAQLLGRLCREYNLQLDCYRSDACLGILNGHFRPKRKAQTTNLYYLAQFCLIHLGDIARYQKNIAEAESFYVHAWRIRSDNGHALNQLAILETSRGRHLSALYLYVRSLNVRNPFLLAAGNIEKFCDTIEVAVAVQDSSISNSSCLSIFFNLFSSAHNCRRLDETQELAKTFSKTISEAVESEEIDANDLENMLIITIGEIWKITSAGDDSSTIYAAVANRGESSSSLLAVDEFRCLRILFDLFRATVIAAMQSIITKSIDTEIDRSIGTGLLVVVKLASDYLRIHPEIFCVNASSQYLFFSTLAALLNQLQSIDIFKNNKIKKLKKDSALPEDKRLQGFLPLEKIHAAINFDEKKATEENINTKTRIIRLLSFGKFISEHLQNSDLFFGVFTESTNEEGNSKQKSWIFSAKKEEKSRPTPSTSPLMSADHISSTKSTKRQTKVVPLITILEREKEKLAATESKENQKSIDQSIDQRSEISKSTTKTVRIKTPDPIPKDYPSTFLAASTDRHDLAPRFQAARLKQALTGEGKLQQQLVSESGYFPSAAQDQQQPYGIWPPQRVPDFRLTKPSLMMPPPPSRPTMERMDNFHRTPGARPPGPPPFPLPAAMFTEPPPGFPPLQPPQQQQQWSTATGTSAPWDPRSQAAAPSLYMGRHQDPYFRTWDAQQQRQQQQQRQLNTREMANDWGQTDWKWSYGQAPNQQQTMQEREASPFYDSNSSRTNENRYANLENVAQFSDANSQNRQQPIPVGEQHRSQQDAHFSLFGIDSPWEYASDRLLSQSGKD